MRKLLGVNIDHVATVRQARRIDNPEPVFAAALAEQAGADGITIHLREDRRHIQERDLHLLRQTVKTNLNLEMALSEEILKIALEALPDEVCIVPERRQEVTTEGGLNAVENLARLKEFIPEFHKKGILVSLFIDPDKKQADVAKEVEADYIELHTGSYANTRKEAEIKKELDKITDAAVYAASLGLKVNAGHGLNYQNTYSIALIPELEVLNIGHSIISRAIFTGLEQAVRDMLAILDRANQDTGK